MSASRALGSNLTATARAMLSTSNASSRCGTVRASLHCCVREMMSMSSTLTRTLSPRRDKTPVSRWFTASAFAIASGASPLPRNRSVELLGATRSCSTRANRAVRSSASPSLRYDCAVSPVRLEKGSTAILALPLLPLRESAYANASPVRTSTIGIAMAARRRSVLRTGAGSAVTTGRARVTASSRSATKIVPVAGRRAGSTSRDRCTSAATADGTSGRRPVTDGAPSSKRRANMTAGAPSTNGRTPASISCTTTPSAYTSAWG